MYYVTDRCTNKIMTIWRDSICTWGGWGSYWRRLRVNRSMMAIF